MNIPNDEWMAALYNAAKNNEQEEINSEMQKDIFCICPDGIHVSDSEECDPFVVRCNKCAQEGTTTECYWVSVDAPYGDNGDVLTFDYQHCPKCDRAEEIAA